MDDLLKEQMINAPHLKEKIQQQLEMGKKMPPKAPEPKAQEPPKAPEPPKPAPTNKPKKENFLDLYWQQMNILIKASEETKQKMEKLHAENRTMNANMIKLLRRVETLENKVESSNASIPEF